MPEPSSEAPKYMCVASVLPVRRWRQVLAFVRLSMKVKKQMLASPGLVNGNMRADFLRKRFYTYTVWRDKATMLAFVRAEPHATALRRFAPWTAPGAAFAEWTSSEGAVDWREGMRRLENPALRFGNPALYTPSKGKAPGDKR